jgi:uncharacterized membrane protein HdeD (DUF308 family)
MRDSGLVYGFLSGISVSAFTNVLIGLKKDQITEAHWPRLVSMMLFLVCGWLFVRAAIRVSNRAEHQMNEGLVWQAVLGIVFGLTAGVFFVVDVFWTLP